MTATNGAGMKAKGSAFERDVVRVLRAHGHPDSARAYGAGRPQDVGDVAGVAGFAIEAKCCRSIDLAGFADEALREAVNAGPGTIGLVVAKRRGRPTEDAYAVMRLSDFADLAALLAETPEHSPHGWQRHASTTTRPQHDPEARHGRRPHTKGTSNE